MKFTSGFRGEIPKTESFMLELHSEKTVFIVGRSKT